MASAAQSQEDEALQQRLARFGVVAGGLGFLALLFRTPDLILALHKPTVPAAYAWHAAAAGTLIVVALLARYWARSRANLLLLDTIGVPASALFYGLMGYSLVAAVGAPFALSARLIVVLAVSYTIFARATYVPSTGARTFAITASCFPGIAIACFGGQAGGGLQVSAIAAQLMWWTLATIIATLASNVIYGLRKEVLTVRQYGQYTLEEKVGEGGMGVVYQASHAMLRRPTALKLLPPERAGGISIARFEKEVRLTARLTHPNTVTIFDYGRTPDGVFYYAMELLDGETLEDIVATTGPLPASRVVRIARQITSALAEAHELGLVHRDVKPANIMLCANLGGESDVVKVLDFGLVRDQNSDLGVTSTTTFAGTPLYMSPEAITDPANVEASSDIYAVGAVLYYLLVGEPVFEATTTIEICASHLHSEPTPPSRRTTNAIPEELETLVVSCLAKTPVGRPRSARVLARQLAKIEASLSETWDEEHSIVWWEDNRSSVTLHRRQRTTKTLSRAPVNASRTLEIDFVRR